MSSFPFMMLFSTLLMSSTMIAISASHWVMLWIALELNMLAYIPMMFSSSWHNSSEAALKYFLAQALGSMLILLGALTMETNILLAMGLLIKVGLAPFHYWFPQVMAALSWPMCMVLTTWQKIIPLITFMYTYNPVSKTTMLIASLSALVGGLGGINQTQIRPLLAYSSIGHMGWVIAATYYSKMVALTYFSIYVLISIPLMMLFWMNSKFSINSMTQTTLMTPMSMIMLIILLLSLSGMPPFSGFLPKWMVLLSLNSFITPAFLILGSLMNLYYYLNICFSASLKMPYMLATKHKFTDTQKLLTLMFMIPATCTLPILFL